MRHSGKQEVNHHRAEEKVCEMKPSAKEQILQWVDTILCCWVVFTLYEYHYQLSSYRHPQGPHHHHHCSEHMHTYQEIPTYPNFRKVLYLLILRTKIVWITRDVWFSFKGLMMKTS